MNEIAAPQVPPPGESLEVSITDLSSAGGGVGRTASGLVVMVRDALPGERVRATVTRAHRAFVEAEAVDWLERSGERIEPRCSHFGSCGGCALQNLSGEAQRHWKGERLRQLIRRTGGLEDIPVEPVRSVGEAYGYRHRMEFSVGPAPGGPVLGLHDRQGEVFQLSECFLPHPDIAACALRLRDLVREPAGRGLRRADIRRSRQSGDILVALSGVSAAHAKLAPALRAAGVAAATLSHPGARRPVILLKGGEIHEKIAGIEVPLTGGFFIQTHPEGAEALYREAVEGLSGAAGPVLDLYAGAGLLGMCAAREMGDTLAVETSRAAVAAGEAAVRRAGLPVRFRRGEVRTVARDLAAAGKRFGAATLNPPRAGLHRSLPPVLSQLGVERIAYVSCNPATLARDLGRLEAAGYATEGVCPFDLFPQTAELEAVARLRRRS